MFAMLRAAALAAYAMGHTALGREDPSMIGAYPGEVGALPNGTVVEIGGMKYETVHLPQAEPTLSPERWKNYHPVMSPTEYHAQFTEPTEPPEKDCVREPEKSSCDCKEMIAACNEETYACEVSLRTLSKEAPSAQKTNYISKFNHPLLNTLMQLRKRSGMKQPSSQCGACFRRMVDDKKYGMGERVYPSPEEVAEKNGDTDDDMSRSLLQTQKAPDMQKGILAGSLNKGDGGLKHQGKNAGSGGKAPDWFAKKKYGYTPSTFGWRIDASAPKGISDESLDSSIRIGGCTLPEVTGLQECLTYFWSCDENRNKLWQMVRRLNHESDWIDTHPGTRPGIYSGAD